MGKIPQPGDPDYGHIPSEKDLMNEVEASLWFCQKGLGFTKQEVEMAFLMKIDHNAIMKFLKKMQDIKCLC
jgi:hypothetical protein